MAISIRIDEKRAARLKRAALRRGLSKSDYVRSAIDAQLDRDDTPASSWDLLKDLCGKFDLGDPALSQRDPRESIRARYLAKHGRRSR
jgi:hypothetical protein